MKKPILRNEALDLLYAHANYDDAQAKKPVLADAIFKFESRIGGKHGAEDARDRFYAGLKKIYAKSEHNPVARSHADRRSSWIRKSARDLAKKAGLQPDEHGSWAGDHISVFGLDFVGHHKSAEAPYFDLGGDGLGLATVSRTRVYAKSSRWGSSTVSTTFLLGKNEIGTYFAHPVSPSCTAVIDALQWIWGGKAYQIIQRQGDIALISGNGGPKMPSRLPSSHKAQGSAIMHDTHPTLPMPIKKGERVIVGRRAAERASEAARD